MEEHLDLDFLWVVWWEEWWEWVEAVFCGESWEVGEP